MNLIIVGMRSYLTLFDRAKTATKDS